MNYLFGQIFAVLDHEILYFNLSHVPHLHPLLLPLPHSHNLHFNLNSPMNFA